MTVEIYNDGFFTDLSFKVMGLEKSNATSGSMLFLNRYLKSLHYDDLVAIINMHFANIQL